MWAWTHPQILVDQADYVVLGTITDVNKEAGQANIKVEETLKGPAKEKIPVKFSPLKTDGGMVISDSDIRYGEGMKGIWILDRPDDKGRHDLTYPLRRMQVEELDKVKALVANFNAIKWSKPVNGLAAAVRAVRPQISPDPVKQYDLSIAVKNVSDKPITVNPHGKFSLKIEGPDGGVEPLPVEAVPFRTWVELKPGQVTYIGWPLQSGS